MDSREPDAPFAAVTEQTSKYGRVRDAETWRIPIEALQACRSRIAARLETCSAAKHATVIPSLPRQINTIHHIPVDRHRSALLSIWTSHLLRARMVHRYVPLINSLSLCAIYIAPSKAFGEGTTANCITVVYSLGIYLLNLFLAFLSPKFDPALEQDEGMESGNAGSLPTKEDQEFRPFVRRLPEFKFWFSATNAILISFFCSWFELFNLPVFWPVLVVYWLILFGLTSESYFPDI